MTTIVQLKAGMTKLILSSCKSLPHTSAFKNLIPIIFGAVASLSRPGARSISFGAYRAVAEYTMAGLFVFDSIIFLLCWSNKIAD